MIRKVLLIDDDPDDADLFAEALQEIDGSMEFYVLKNGIDLVQQLQENKIQPDIIFLDINMPIISGWQCIQVLRNDLELQEIPVIMYSTSSVLVDGKRAIDHGAVCYVEKPSSYLNLKALIRSIVGASADTITAELSKHLANTECRIMISN